MACLTCSAGCTFIDLECIYRNSSLTSAVQIDTRVSVINAAHNDFRSIIGEKCYLDFCAARKSFVFDAVPMSQKWQKLYESEDFRNYLALTIEYHYIVQFGSGIVYAASGALQKDSPVPIDVIKSKENDLKNRINPYLHRLKIMLQTDEYECIECNTCSPCAVVGTKTHKKIKFSND